MAEKYYDVITILLLTAVPLILLLLHTFLSSRRAVIWSFPVPLLWTFLGAWMILAGYEDYGFSGELFLFYLIGDVLLFVIALMIRRMKKRKGNRQD